MNNQKELSFPKKRRLDNWQNKKNISKNSLQSLEKIIEKIQQSKDSRTLYKRRQNYSLPALQKILSSKNNIIFNNSLSNLNSTNQNLHQDLTLNNSISNRQGNLDSKQSIENFQENTKYFTPLKSNQANFVNYYLHTPQPKRIKFSFTHIDENISQSSKAIHKIKSSQIHKTNQFSMIEQEQNLIKLKAINKKNINKFFEKQLNNETLTERISKHTSKTSINFFPVKKSLQQIHDIKKSPYLKKDKEKQQKKNVIELFNHTQQMQGDDQERKKKNL